ncbi:MAG TPA: hypothetical protein VLK34_00020 [Nocardioidaceae bacterium]|nr:hypothetical protein [Nocardioidaceae bacterium]
MQTTRLATTLAIAALLGGVCSSPIAIADASVKTSSATTHARAAGDAAAGKPREVIAWSQFTDLNFSAARIVVSGPHGRHVRVLTHSAEGIVDLDPQISPDGRWIAFERDYPDTSRVVLVGIHGHRQHALDLGCADPCLGDASPTWAPDGQHLLFSRALGPVGPDGNAASVALWRTDLSGQHLKRLSSPGIDGRFEDGGAQFAPDGYMVIRRYSIRRDLPALFRMRRDGTHAVRITPWSISADIFDLSPASSGPTHNLAVFETYGHAPAPDGISSAVAAVSAARKSDHRLRYLTSPTSLPVSNFNPTWSPNGRRVAFVRFKSVKSDPVIHGDIWTMRWNGADRARVSRAKLFDFRPTWGRIPS